MSHALALGVGSTVIAMVDRAERADPHALTGKPKPLTKDTARIPAFSMPLTWANVVQLLRTLPGAAMTDDLQQWLVAELIRRTSDVTLNVPIPDGLVPYPWQALGAARFASVGSAMLSDDPGTGKTITAALGIAERHMLHGDSLPALVVAPASVVSPWYAACREWVPGLVTQAYRGTKRELNPNSHIVVTSYDILMRDVAKLAGYGFATVVFDEHHLIKNPKAKRTLAAIRMAHAAQHGIALSGTPLTHSPDDVFSTLKCLDPGSFPAHDRFTDRFLDTVMDDNAVIVAGLKPDRVDEFATCLLGVWRRVSKDEALPFLPPKVRSTRTVQMPAKWRAAYTAMARTMSADLPDDGGEVDVMNTLTQLTVLTALTAGPCSVTYTPHEDPTKPDHVHTKLIEGSWKIEPLLEVLEERPEQQVLVFSPSRQLIEQAALALDAAHITYGLIVGNQSTKVRDAYKDAFQAGETRVMLATTQAGGVGLTLTAASTVVFLSRPFSLVEATQAEDRAHRIGSERHETIEIVDIVTEDSVDQRVHAILRERGESLDEFLKGASVAQLRALF